jgi:Cu(I)/Ag(I) efflux system membrane fusion protein
MNCRVAAGRASRNDRRQIMTTVRVQSFVLAVAAAALVAAGGGAGYWLRWEKPDARTEHPAHENKPAAVPSPEPRPLYYQSPDGKAEYSTIPKKAADGRDYKPVYGEGAQSPSPAIASTSTGPRKLVYYRNPMGLADTSPVPKKDSMGMDYIPVYQGEDQADVVTVSPGRMQMLGVRTAPVEMRAGLTRTVRGTGSIEAVESSIAVVSPKFAGFVEKLFVATTGATVRAGQPLMRVSIQAPDVVSQMGSDVIARQVDYIVALQEKNQSAIESAQRNLRYYGIPESAITEIGKTGHAVRSITIAAPISGVVMEKLAVEGARFNTGDPLFKLANLSTVWLVADVAEQDLGAIRRGEPAKVSFVAFPERSFTGVVDFIYPALNQNTRTGRVRIVLPNKDASLLGSMYASVAIDTSAAAAASTLVVPDSAVINSGARQVVLVAKGQGRFVPRVVRVGAEANGYTQILGGLAVGEQVVTGANFLIDAESNLRAALASFNGGKP